MNVEFKARGSLGEVWLYDQIGASFWGDGISAKSFQKELSALGKVTQINVHINSPGGDVFDGFAIYNQLKQHPASVEVNVDGVAASIASIIAMAADPGKLKMAKNSLMMIHNPQGGAYGDETELERVIALLKSVKGNLAQTYVDRTGNKADQVNAWMGEETWFTAEAAMQHGFADVVTADSTVTARFDPSGFRNVPDWVKQRLNNSAAQPVLDIRRARIAKALNRARRV
jgi:ATP-dependent Clp endopeptidase proteolytic subunit ClpP